MTVSLKIESPDLKAQLAKFKATPKSVTRHATRAMTASTLTIVSKVVPHVPVYRGRLRRSIVQTVKSTISNVVGRVFSNLKSEIYPDVMNFGRRAGAKMPPPSALVDWVRRKLKVSPERALGVAFVVARSIARKGIKARRFMEKGFEESKADVARFWATAQDRIRDDMVVK